MERSHETEESSIRLYSPLRNKSKDRMTPSYAAKRYHWLNTGEPLISTYGCLWTDNGGSLHSEGLSSRHFPSGT